MNLKEWANEIHKNSVNHGFWEDDRGFPETVALCHAELSEALEEDRSGRPLVWFKCNDNNSVAECCKCKHCMIDGSCEIHALNYKPEGIAVEMIDCLIRILDWCGRNNIDVDEVVRIKHQYNVARPYKHGKRY